MENNEKKGIFARLSAWFAGLTVKGLLQVIFVAFIIIIILFSFSYLPNVIGRISSSLSAALYSIFVPSENATMTSDRIILNSGEDFNVTFKKGDKGDGLFTVSYACDPNLELYSVESAGLKKVDCDSPYYLLNNDTNITLRPITHDDVVRLVLSGALENNDSQKTEKIGVVRVTIKNSLSGVTANVPAQETPAVKTETTVNPPFIPSQPAPSRPSYTTGPDLAIRILQVGLLSQNNIVISRNQFSYQEMVGIKFEVRNDGDTVTGPWSFTASLPSLSTPVYNSNTQISLRPGDSIIFTLGFSNLTGQNQSLITVNVDPANQVRESVETNNVLTAPISVTGYNPNYYNNNYYNNNYPYNYNYQNNGCYVNGYFTYNCLNNYPYNYNYNNYNNYGGLSVSCYADPGNPQTGDRVRWYANVYGGDGNYDYDWSGTNSLNSSTQNPSKTYSSRGTKNATVTVEDGNGDTATASCSVYVN